MKLKNLIQILEKLSYRTPVKASKLSMELGISERGIRRYIKEINEAFEYYPITSGKDGYSISENPLSSTLNRDYPMDILMSSIFATPFGKMLDKLDNKIKDAPSLVNKIEMKSLPNNKQDLQKISLALISGQALEVLYQSREGEKKHLIYPVKLFVDYGLLYLVAYDNDYEHLICMSVNKFLKLTPSHQKLPETQIKDFLRYVDSAWGKMIGNYPVEEKIFEISFSVNEVIKPYFRTNPLHPKQKILDHKNTAKISAPVHNLLEFVRFTLRFGKNIRILSPPQALSHIRRHLNEMREFYEDESF